MYVNMNEGACKWLQYRRIYLFFWAFLSNPCIPTVSREMGNQITPGVLKALACVIAQ